MAEIMRIRSYGVKYEWFLDKYFANLSNALLRLKYRKSCQNNRLQRKKGRLFILGVGGLWNFHVKWF